MKRKTHWLLAVPALVLAAGLAVTFLGWDGPEIGENAHILRELDCYCGCMEMETDPHDSSCAAAAVAEWSKEGKTLEEIRQLTVETFKPAV